MSYIKIACISDLHLPYIDERSNEVMLKFLKHFKPHKIKILGDVIDLWQISKFDTDPMRTGTLQDDIDATRNYLYGLRDMFPKTKFSFLSGNHEDRLRKYKWREAKKFASLRSLRIDRLLGIDKLKIDFYPEQTDVERDGDMLFTHGTLVSKDSAMTARNMLKKYGCSLVMGHTHRLGSYYETKINGTIGGFENGCLCKAELAREWRQGFPNWQNGFTIVYMKGKRFIVNQIFISKGQLLYGSKEFIV